jgi:hypothetical protein
MTPMPVLRRSERGVVLPLAMLSLLMLSAVLIGLSTLTGEEPLIAANHVMTVQAHALAEAGLERALWALSTPTAEEGVAWSAAAPVPYDASRVIPVSVDGVLLGGFRLGITGNGDRQRQVLATGLVPGNSGPLGQARHQISATAIRLRFPSPPASLTVRGDLRVGAGVTVDAVDDDSCGDLAGTWSSGITTVGAGSQVQGHGDGAKQEQPQPAFDERAFDPAELTAMKAVARLLGTYYRGTVTFNAARPMPNGLIFVDTASGTGITEATPESDLAAVSIGDGATGGAAGGFRGWIVVNGSISISGTVSLEGLVFAADRLSQTGGARLLGAAMAGHARSRGPSELDAHPANGPAVVWNCETARTGGHLIPQRWMVKPGSYREMGG